MEINLTDILSSEWLSALDEQVFDVLVNISSKLSSEKLFYPPLSKIFAALNACPPERVKVVIVGQDPYFHENEADGFAFSCSFRGIRNIPSSLRTIRDELRQEYGREISPDLRRWANDGVLLLNQILTVGDKPLSHMFLNWQCFTGAVLTALSKNKSIIYLSFGAKAKEFLKKYLPATAIIIQVGHPSPLNTTVPFLGCNVFRACNERLLKMKLKPIRWV
jgi:uracil-DNA glycosylase